MSTPGGGPRLAPGGLRELRPVIWGFSRIAGRAMGTDPPAVFTTLGRHRRLFWGWLHFAGRLMPGGRLPRRETELVILRVAHLSGSDYELAHHSRLGRRVGIDAETLARVEQGPDAPGWSRREHVLLRATDELHETRDLGDDTWDQLRSELDEASSIELLMLVGHYEMLATTLAALRLRPDPPR